MPTRHQFVTSTQLLLLGLSLSFSGNVLAMGNKECLDAPPLELSNKNIVNVRTSQELSDAIRNLTEGTTVLIANGTYRLKSTIAVTSDNVTIRGAGNDCNSVKLLGPGMTNRGHGGIFNGIWIKAKNTVIANLSLSDLYFHTISIDGNAQSPHIYNVRLTNSGQQFIKVNPREYGKGVDNGVVEYSILDYPDGPSTTDRNNSGTGYTGGIDIHGGSNWRISNNRFSNFHMPDDVEHLWNHAVLAWNGSKHTITENNTFIDVDRSIGYGLRERDNENNDHFGGIIRNNMIVKSPGLFTKTRKKQSDASILVWNSPDTKVLHNSILTNGNTPFSIELRWNTRNVEVTNNMADAPIDHRDSKSFIAYNNHIKAQREWFVDPATGNLRLQPGVAHALDRTSRHRQAEFDIDGERRPFGKKVDLGADEVDPKHVRASN